MSGGNGGGAVLESSIMEHSASPASDSWRARERAPLPTRVRNACDRCRRNKSRCDAFRPCSLCLRADAKCVSLPVGSGPPQKRRRFHKLPSYHSVHKSSGASWDDLRRLTDPSRDMAVHDQGRLLQQSSEMYEPKPSGRPVSASPVPDHQEAESTMGIARRIFQLDRQYHAEPAAPAMPDGEGSGFVSDSTDASPCRLPLHSVLGCSLPSADTMRLLMGEYFESVHWFSIVIYEPSFRPQFESICDGHAHPAQRSFLLLLSTVLGIAAWYRSKRTTVEPQEPRVDWSGWATKLIKHTESQLFDILNQSSLASIQTCILLGSYNSYHGKPKSAFALLGATIKTAQAIGLHRLPKWREAAQNEERKRVWWTIYTWDRWASITYGRPLCIKDQDCNTSMPEDVFERIEFDAVPDRNNCFICYSAYQRELNKLYIISSPMIETIFGRQPSNKSYPELAKKVSHELSQWREHLPPHLVLDFDHDIPANASTMLKAHQLQALALQLTFDHLIIILHRPFLLQQISMLSQKTSGTATEAHPPSSGLSDPSLGPQPQLDYGPELSNVQLVPNSEEWWNAAVRTSKVTQLPYIARLAIDGHLVAFLAINLFNSAIVMVVCALSNPLSNRAQVAKRNITQIFRLQELFGQRSKLSTQSSLILHDVIRLIVQREADAMLAPIQSPKGSKEAFEGETGPSMHLTTEESLRLSNWASSQSVLPGSPTVTSEDALRFNESLSSLQKVFLHNDVLGQDFTCGLENQPNWQGSEFPPNSSSGVTDLSAQDTNLLLQRALDTDSFGDGLYWMWNSMDEVWS